MAPASLHGKRGLHLGWCDGRQQYGGEEIRVAAKSLSGLPAAFRLAQEMAGLLA
jgi:hypothetical protein